MTLKEREAWKHETIRASNAETKVQELEADNRRLQELEGEIGRIDQLLSRRDALDDCPTRYDKISFAITVASRAEKFQAKAERLQDMYQVHYKARIAAEAEVERLLSYVDGNDKDVEIGNLEARVKELEELLGEETYAERAAVRHYKRIKELEEGLRECCRMFEWCDTRYGQLLEEK